MSNDNFFTPKTKKLSLTELLEFYELGIKVVNYEQQAPVYIFFKKADKQIPAFWRKFGFNNNETLYSTTNHDEINQVIKTYIKNNCSHAKEINNGMYEINY